MSCVGNDNIHLLTSDGRQYLRIDLADVDDNHVYAEYDKFIVGSEEEKYKLHSVGSYMGNASQYNNFLITFNLIFIYKVESRTVAKL